VVVSEAGEFSAALPWHVTSGEYAPGTVERLLRALPDWFGIDSANVEYVNKAREVPAYLAWPSAESLALGGQRQPVGVLLPVRHFPQAAEIYLMAVDPGMHRRGAGRALVEALEADLIADGVEFLQVKTLGPSRPDANYDNTRRFYARMGFRPLEEIADLWTDNPCLIMVKALPNAISRRAASRSSELNWMPASRHPSGSSIHT
jgi:ribosomal protein S18 acetylase RimI-like enzyme